MGGSMGDFPYPSILFHMDLELNPFKPDQGCGLPRWKVGTSRSRRSTCSSREANDATTTGGMVLSGLRGVGKTTLLNTLAEHADREGWLTIGIEARPNAAGTAAVRAKLGQELTVGLRRYSRKHKLQKLIDPPLIELARGFSVEIGLGPATVNVGTSQPAASSGDIDLDIEELVEAITSALKPRGGSAFGLFIDEMQDLDADLLSALLTVQHRASQREWPFFLIGAGLPNLPAILAENRSYAERQFLYSTVGPPLDRDAAADALRIPVRQHGGDFTDDALDVLVTASGGYPYFLQEFGKAIWNLAPEAPFQTEDAELAVEVGRRHLDEGFFPSRWNRATDRERRYLTALAATGEDAPRSGKVAELMGGEHERCQRRP